MIVFERVLVLVQEKCLMGRRKVQLKKKKNILGMISLMEVIFVKVEIYGEECFTYLYIFGIFCSFGVRQVKCLMRLLGSFMLRYLYWCTKTKVHVRIYLYYSVMMMNFMTVPRKSLHVRNPVTTNQLRLQILFLIREMPSPMK